MYQRTICLSTMQSYDDIKHKNPANAFMSAFAGSTGNVRGKVGENSGELLLSWLQRGYYFQSILNIVTKVP